MDREQTTDTQLEVYEWAAVITVIASILFIAILSWLGDTDEEIFNTIPTEVVISGAVRYPGSYPYVEGSTVATLLKDAEPLSHADLRRINRKGNLYPGQMVHIKSRPLITIYLEGAVKTKGAVRLPHGTKVNELISEKFLEEKADITKINKKRFLRSGEHIFIPYIK